MKELEFEEPARRSILDEREEHSLPITRTGDRSAWVPAARCRECGVVTWKVSMAQGTKRVEDAEHVDGCSQPPGRLDLRERGVEVNRPATTARLLELECGLVKP